MPNERTQGVKSNISIDHGVLRILPAQTDLVISTMDKVPHYEALNSDPSSSVYYKFKPKYDKNGPGQIEEQWKMAQTIHSILPQYTPVPLGPIRLAGTNEIIGYKVEKVDGITLSDFIETDYDRETAEGIIAQLQDFADSLRYRGFAHGDLHVNNIIIKEGRIKVIDPAAEPDPFVSDSDKVNEIAELLRNRLLCRR